MANGEEGTAGRRTMNDWTAMDDWTEENWESKTAEVRAKANRNNDVKKKIGFGRMSAETIASYAEGLNELFSFFGRLDAQNPGLRFDTDLARRRSLFSASDAVFFKVYFASLIELRNYFDFPGTIYREGPSWLREVCEGGEPDTHKIFWGRVTEDNAYNKAVSEAFGVPSDIGLLSHLSTIVLGHDLIERTCLLLSALKKWPSKASDERYNASQNHIRYFEEHPSDTIALFSLAWHDDLSPEIKTMRERFVEFAALQGPDERRAVMEGAEMLLDHRIFYMHKVQKSERGPQEVKEILDAVKLLCESAIHREYIEKLVNSKGLRGDTTSEKWAACWRGEVDAAIRSQKGPLWDLLRKLGHPAKASAVECLKGTGTRLWKKFSDNIHQPKLRAVEDHFEPSKIWNRDDRGVMLVLKQMAKAKERIPHESRPWETSVYWR